MHHIRFPQGKSHVRAALSFGLIALLACMTTPDGSKVVSTSISTDNPAGLTLYIKRDSKPISFTGTLEIYESDQIPAEGYRPNPLLRKRIENSDLVLLDTTAITGIPKELWQDTLIEDPASSVDTLLKFNIVLKGDSLGAILKGFSFDLHRRRLIPSSENGGADSLGIIHADLSGLVEYIGRLPPSPVYAFKDFYLFIYGTGYVAKGAVDAEKGDSLQFSLPKLPEGQHDAFLISFPKGDGPVSGIDSTDIFNLESPLRTDSDTLRRGTIERRVELPDSLKRP